jgi:subtilisin family serine protease
MRKAISWIASVSLIGSLFFINNPQVNAKAPVDVLQATGPVLFKLNLSKAIPRISANIPYDSGYKGQGSYVVVIDSGVQSDHPFLAGKVALEACFAPVCPNGTTKQIGPGAAKPVHWHGTHVAGIIAGSNATMHGVAPEAKIIAVNIFNAAGSTYDENIIEALTWVDSISSDYNIASVNMSLGTSQVFKTSCNNYIPALTSIIATLKSKNIATVIAAGNSYAYGMSSPACITDSVSVAATYVDKDLVTNFSNVHEDTDLAAPGYGIYSSDSYSNYRVASGTSMAAPMVAGSYAVYRSKFGIQSVDKVTSDFRSTGIEAKDDYTALSVKRIDFKSLFNNGSPPPTTTPPPITTTTLPGATTTTTTTIPPADDDVEFGLSTPYIVSLKKYKPNTSFMYLDFVYRYNEVTKLSSFILDCRYTGSSNTTKSVPNRNKSYNSYFIKMSTASIRSCRMAAVGEDGTIGDYTNFVLVK